MIRHARDFARHFQIPHLCLVDSNRNCSCLEYDKPIRIRLHISDLRILLTARCPAKSHPIISFSRNRYGKRKQTYCRSLHLASHLRDNRFSFLILHINLFVLELKDFRTFPLHRSLGKRYLTLPPIAEFVFFSSSASSSQNFSQSGLLNAPSESTMN